MVSNATSQPHSKRAELVFLAVDALFYLKSNRTVLLRTQDAELNEYLECEVSKARQ
jgi:hypothetical protein